MPRARHTLTIFLASWMPAAILYSCSLLFYFSFFLLFLLSFPTGQTPSTSYSFTLSRSSYITLAVWEEMAQRAPRRPGLMARRYFPSANSHVLLFSTPGASTILNCNATTFDRVFDINRLN